MLVLDAEEELLAVFLAFAGRPVEVADALAFDCRREPIVEGDLAVFLLDGRGVRLRGDHRVVWNRANWRRLFNCRLASWANDEKSGEVFFQRVGGSSRLNHDLGFRRSLSRQPTGRGERDDRKNGGSHE